MVPFVALFLLVVGWLAVAIGAHLKSVPVLALGTVTVIILGMLNQDCGDKKNRIGRCQEHTPINCFL